MDTKKLTRAGIFTAIIAVTIIAINIPIPLAGASGYLNAGEGAIFLAALILGDYSAAIAAGLGAAIADLTLGYTVYAPISFIVKAIEAGLAVRLLKKTKIPVFPCLLIAAIINPLGYGLAEAFIYGWKVSLVGIPANLAQSIFGAIIASLIYKALEKNKSRK